MNHLFWVFKIGHGESGVKWIAGQIPQLPFRGTFLETFSIIERGAPVDAWGWENPNPMIQLPSGYD